MPAGMDEYTMVGFTLRNTLSEFGHVSRGVCARDLDGFLKTIVEHVGIDRDGAGARIPRADGEGTGAARTFTGDEIVSMNLWGFRPSIFGHLRAQFADFLTTRGEDPKAEFYIPTVVDRLIDAGRARVRILETSDRWFGVTYREDKESAVGKIREMIDAGIYPEKLWAHRSR
jgi:hypothetical protein